MLCWNTSLYWQNRDDTYNNWSTKKQVIPTWNIATFAMYSLKTQCTYVVCVIDRFMKNSSHQYLFCIISFLSGCGVINFFWKI